ncbi:uncharacterized protein LOC111644037 [Copidosoma floridanum]|uniref:uncharacterized protein LOC111644037 n=1 Tax=Copidosoma floridanum TaxID=29053 RepID=UPI000C6F8E67|nr:uncharacterized protein LOC111644037 [Copidosoma floridanum]
MTIPRLELRAALLAARLLRLVDASLTILDCTYYLWSDSSTVLSWLYSSEPVGNDLVDNYVHHIQELTAHGTWRYVPSSDNPADIATRGAEPSTLQHNTLWWTGPSWLTGPPSTWPSTLQQPPSPTGHYDGGRHTIASTTCLTILQGSRDFMDDFSNLLRMLQVLVRCRRFILILRTRIECKKLMTGIRIPDCMKSEAPITVAELQHSLLCCAKLSQVRYFAADIKTLKNSLPVKISSPLSRLSAFLDDEGILRVGGRLRHSLLAYEEKHPPVLDARCPLSRLVIDWAHQRALHGGFRSTYSHVMRRAWIVGGAVEIKRRVHQCVVCSKAPARPLHQFMAPLPTARVTPARPFTRTGVDYAGPFSILRSKGRGAKSVKGYVAVFVCMWSKALHLEPVGDLTTASFLGALTRFIGRRGKPKEIWSDNATNFHGADHELKQLMAGANHDWDSVAESLANEGIDWHFIPPSAPHFGGLWEAGVKSMKTHLRRVVGTRHLTFEEFSTLLAEIEMILNCRPLGPLSGDTEDLDMLTPAHFLIGGPLTSLPATNTSENLDCLTHWTLVQGMRDALWRRWTLEYLNTLQQRTKWSRPRPNLAVGDVVLVVDPTLLNTIGKWPLGRIVDVKPGPDGSVRVIRVRTASGEYVRPITKIARLPVIERANHATDDPGPTGTGLTAGGQAQNGHK